MDAVERPERRRVAAVDVEQGGEVVLQGALVGQLAGEQLAGRLDDAREVVPDALLAHARRALALDRRRGELAEARIAPGVGQDRAERHAVEEVLEPASAGEREPRRADGEGGHAEAGVGGEEEPGAPRDLELLDQRAVEGVQGRARMGEQLVQLRAAEARRGAAVAGEAADQRDARVGERLVQGVEDQRP
ncbi:hypothetical protein [Candidatus Solirubrobacter pratensis]|uniref:hypothetical protein n=1 Tax=Candidatus Solirubrobacter pratensis TaxID=1298857 RepID=UPI0012DF7531|nr:hypothetical protein [Candidatus Solirubrobacter pratensis]